MNAPELEPSHRNHLGWIVQSVAWLAFCLWLLMKARLLSIRADELAVAAVYIVVGVHLEERDLRATFGGTYEEYRQRVPMIVPWTLGRGTSG